MLWHVPIRFENDVIEMVSLYCYRVKTTMLCYTTPNVNMLSSRQVLVIMLLHWLLIT